MYTKKQLSNFQHHKVLTNLVINTNAKIYTKPQLSFDEEYFGNIDDVPVSKEYKLDIINIYLPTERAIVQKRITEWIRGNAMDIFNDE